MSPFLSYIEVMPAKPSKDWVSHGLVDTLKRLRDRGQDTREPPTKRLKGASEVSKEMIKELVKSKTLQIGLN